MQNNNQSAKADNGKPKLSLVPTEIINCIAKCREFGVAKYHDPDNWKDVEKERYIDAAYRHWIKYVEDNNSIDEESGLPHLWHCACNLAFLCEFDKVERETEQTKENIFKANTNKKFNEHRRNDKLFSVALHCTKNISEAKQLYDEIMEAISNLNNSEYLDQIKAELCKHYVPHVISELNIKNCRNCQYFNGRECTAFPNEHKECENK